jgi:hypothetical protein
MLVEFRCGATTGNSAQDVLPPTIHPSGKPYAWKLNNEMGDWRTLPVLPKPLHDIWLAMVRKPEPVTPSERNDTPVNLKWLEELVFARDADCTEPEWWECGAIISHETDHSDEGYELFDRWSATGTSKYEGPEATRKKWDEIGSRPDVATPATIGKLLRETTARDEDFGAPLDQDVLAQAEAAEKEKLLAQFHWYSIDDMLARPPVHWFVYSIFPESDDLLFVAGIPGAGKSFIALSVSLAVARGVPWFGYPTEQGNACYIAAEGFSTFTTRLQAYMKHNDLPPGSVPGFKLLGAGVTLTDTTQMTALAESAKQFSPKLIVIDTLAAAAGNVDHNTSDMQKVIDGAKLLRKHTGATVMIVAHIGKDETKGIMGWTGVTANAETIANVKELDDSVHRDFRISKQRNGIEGVSHLWKLVPIDLGRDDKDQPIIGAVADFIGIAKAEDNSKPKRKRTVSGKWTDAVQRVLFEAGEGLSNEELRKRVKKYVPLEDHGANASARISEAIETLVEVDAITQPPLAGDGLYRLKDPGPIGGNPDTRDGFGPVDTSDCDSDIL